MREPLLHFLVIGGLLFVTYSLINNDVDTNNSDNRIIFSIADIDRLNAIWKKRWQRLSSQAELKGLINQQIREEVMYREALALGLDKNDSIVRRRLAQMLEFITSDLAAQIEPTESELLNW